MIEMPERIVAASEERDRALWSAQLHAIVPVILYAFTKAIHHPRADELYLKRLLVYKNRYHQADRELRRIDEEEGFPAIKTYIKSLLEITNELPYHLKTFAYYPFAGCDIFWGAVFPSLILEDKNYNSQQDDPTNWWSVEDYSTDNLDRLVGVLKISWIIPEGHRIVYVTADSESNSSVKIENPTSVTLIYKSGHYIDGYIKSRFGNEEVPFGAVIIANDMSSDASREKVLARHNYRKVCEVHPPHIPVPYALPLANVHVFVKK